LASYFEHFRVSSSEEILPFKSIIRARNVSERAPEVHKIHKLIIARIISERKRSKNKAIGEKLTGSLRINQFTHFFLLQGRCANELPTGWSPPEEESTLYVALHLYIRFTRSVRIAHFICLVDPWETAPCPSITSTRSTTWRTAEKSRWLASAATRSTTFFAAATTMSRTRWTAIPAVLTPLPKTRRLSISRVSRYRFVLLHLN